jgi:hypothetical protein
LYGQILNDEIKSVSDKPLFKAPVGRSVDAFMTKSAVHGEQTREEVINYDWFISNKQTHTWLFTIHASN